VGSTARALDDEFAPRLSFFFNAHNDFFEEIAKYRAARKIWAMLDARRFGAKAERSLKLRSTHRRPGARSPGSSRRTILCARRCRRWRPCWRRAVAAHQFARRSLCTAKRARRHDALRTQQVIAYESGVAAEPDPLGGSYFLEHLTRASEESAWDYIRRIDAMGA